MAPYTKTCPHCGKICSSHGYFLQHLNQERNLTCKRQYDKERAERIQAMKRKREGPPSSPSSSSSADNVGNSQITDQGKNDGDQGRQHESDDDFVLMALEEDE